VKSITEGARRVAELVAKIGAAEFGRRVKVSEGMARHLATGRKTAGVALRDRIATVVGIPAEAWDEPAKVVEAKPSPKPKAPATEPDEDTTIGRYLRTVADIDATLADDIPASAKASLYRARLDALHRISVLRGEHELTMAQLVRSRIWRDIQARLETALASYPEAATAIADALEDLDS
jgi:hypothetical protein